MLGTWLLRKPDSQVGHVLDYPFEIKGGQRVNIHVWRGVHKVDGIRNAVTNSPLDRIHIVYQRAPKLERILYDATSKIRAEMLVFNEILALVRIILDRHHFLLPQTDATDVLVPLNEFLYDNRAQAKLVIVKY